MLTILRGAQFGFFNQIRMSISQACLKPLSRTVVLGEPDVKSRKILCLVRKVRKAGIKAASSD